LSGLRDRIAKALFQDVSDPFALRYRRRYLLDKSSNVVRKVVVPVLGK